MKLNPSRLHITVGEVSTLYVIADGLDRLWAYQMRIVANDTVQIISIVPEPEFELINSENNKTIGALLYPSEPLSGPAILAAVTIKGISSGVSIIEFVAADTEATNIAGDGITLEFTEAVITVS